MNFTKYMLNKSILFDVYTYPKNSEGLRSFVHKFTLEFISECNFKKTGEDNELYKDSIKQLLFNCVVSMIMQRPIAITLNRNDYNTGKRLKKLFLSYTHTVNVFKCLHLLGYIELANGAKELGKTTRFWPSENLMNELMPYITAPPIKYHNGETVLLRKKKVTKNSKALQEFTDTDHPDIPQIKADIAFINEEASKHKLTLDLSKRVVPSSFLDLLIVNRMNGEISISDYECHYKIVRSLTDNVYENVIDKGNYRFEYFNYKLIESNSKNMILNNISIEPLPILYHKNSDDRKKYYNRDILNSCILQSIDWIAIKGGQDYYYLDRLNVEFNNNELTRIFNVDFDHGGRFTNLYQRIPADLRPYLLIDGERTVEVDIEACTLQMLYHHQGIECPEHPYSLLSGKSKAAVDNSEKDKIKLKTMVPNKVDGNEILSSTDCIFPLLVSFPLSGLSVKKLKKIHKFIQIVLANAMDKHDKIDIDTSDLDQPSDKPVKTKRTLTAEESAKKAINYEIQKSEYANFSYAEIEALIEKFKVVHEKIKHHLFKGIGRTLQNIESKIANKVLLHFAKKKIMCLCIHDSFRIAARHKEELIEVLKSAYKEELGFTPALTVEE